MTDGWHSRRFLPAQDHAQPVGARRSNRPDVGANQVKHSQYAAASESVAHARAPAVDIGGLPCHALGPMPAVHPVARPYPGANPAASANIRLLVRSGVFGVQTERNSVTVDGFIDSA